MKRTNDGQGFEPATEPAPHTVTRDIAHEFTHHSFVVEASDLQIPPGTVPGRLDTTLGNGQPFFLRAAGDGYWDYMQGNGCLKLRVFND